MTAPQDDNGSEDSEAVDSPDALAERMKPFEPYLAAELAADLDLQVAEAEAFLESLEADDRVRRKQPLKAKPIWIREPTPQACPNCGREFGIKYRHVVLSAARFCPRCGTRL